MNDDPSPDVIEEHRSKFTTSKMIKAGVMLTVGALLIGGGATLAAWEQTSTGTDTLIQAGGMSLEIDPDVQVYDVSPNSEDNGQEIDPSVFEVVPGDVIRIIQDIEVSLLGNNIYANLTGEFSGSTGGVNLTSVVKLVDGIESPTGAIPEDNVLATAYSYGAPEIVNFESQGDYHYKVIREITFPNAGSNLDSVNASSVVDGSRWTLTQTRKPSAIGPSVLDDPSLSQVVRDALGLQPNQPVNTEDIAGLQHIDASNRGITSIAGLESAVNLTSLNISGNSISDLSPLASMTRLQSIDATSNNLADINPLGSIVTLSSIHVANNEISDIKPLTTMKNLKSLDISNNKVTTLGYLNNIKPTLVELSAHHNKIADNTSVELGGWSVLTKMDLSHNLVAGVPSFGSLPLLTDLDISNNQITGISIVSSGLKTVDVSHNRLTALSGLLKGAVTNLDASHNLIVDASTASLSKINNVEMNLSYNKIVDATIVVKYSLDARKISFDLTNNGLSNLAAFAGKNPNLKVLKLGEGNTISNITPLSTLRTVERLDFTGNLGVISDWSPVSNLPEGVVIK